MADTLSRLKSILAEHYDVDGDVGPEHEFSDDLDLDSLEVVELVQLVEDEFGIEINDEELADVETVGDLQKLVDRKNPRKETPDGEAQPQA